MLDASVQRAFSLAAHSYDAAAGIQQASARALLAMLPETAPRRALDIGCGTLPLIRPLRAAFDTCHWLALDVSTAMLAEARDRGRCDEQVSLVCADAEALPLASDSVDLVYSSFALQWAASPERAVAEAARVMTPGATLALCLPLAGSLAELRDSWAQADAGEHVNALAPLTRWQQALASAGLGMDVSQQVQVVEYYDDVRAVATMLRTTGAHVVRGRAGGLVSPRRFAHMQAAYERRRQPRGLPLTWQVGYLVAHKPAADSL